MKPPTSPYFRDIQLTEIDEIVNFDQKKQFFYTEKHCLMFKDSISEPCASAKMSLGIFQDVQKHTFLYVSSSCLDSAHETEKTKQLNN